MPDVDVNVSYLPPARKRLGYRLAHNAVDMRARVVADRLHFRRIRLAVRKRRFFNGAIEDAADDIAVILIHRNKFALENERKLRHHRRIDRHGLRRGKAALRDFVRRVIAAHDSEIIAGANGLDRSERDRKRLARGDIRPGFVRGIDADRYFIFQRHAAPRGVHHIRRSVFVVRADHQYRHRKHPVLLAEILFHHHPLSVQFVITP